MKIRFYRKPFFILFLLAISVNLQAQQTNVQSPTEFLGYELGSEWTPHHKVMDYFWYVTENSPTVEAQQYGKTYEGRELMLAFVSSRANLDRLEEIRTNNLKRTGLVEGEPAADSTAIVWLSYNVHGNETSSSEAAMKTIYELVNPENSETKTWLQNTVVIMDPMLNPDGRDRYVHWFKETAGKTPNVHIDAREHHEPWPGGRSNHYYFDLNRDWAWLTQKETRQRVDEYQKWMPHIHVDFHEQGYDEPYYFAPAARPFHNAITDWQTEFQYTIGKNHARYFNQNNWLYFTREVFDLFYPSYGDTYPIFNGAIGMTYEQGGHSLAGLGILKAEGDTLTLSDRLTHHFTTGLSTVEISSKNADRLVNEFSSYYQTARNNPQGEYKTFVIKGDNNPDKLRALFSLLDKHQVEYGKATRSRSTDGYNYDTGESQRVQISEDDYLVSAHQPKSVMARVLFEPRPELEDSLTYDITAWEQHYAFGLEGYALGEQLEIAAASAPEPEVREDAVENAYAYLARWQDLSDVKLLADLLKRDINVRFASKSFKIDNREYDSGTLIITRSDNKNRSEFDDVIREIAKKHHQKVDAVETGFVQDGSDFGSASVNYLKRPQVAMLSGSGTSSYRVGEIWHYFDQQIGYPLTLLDTSYFNDIDLGKYDVLILPSNVNSNKLDKKHLNEIKDWVTSGGKLIAVSGANELLADHKDFNLKSKDGKNDQDTTTVETQEGYGDQSRKSISGNNAGSVYKISMDPTHPLAFGYDDSYFSLKLGADAYSFLDDGWNVGVAKEDAHMSGFVGYKAKEKLENTLAFGAQKMGEGSVVYMVDNPLFRAFWYNGKLLFGNAVFLVGQ